MNRQCSALKAELDEWSHADQVLDKAQDFGTSLGAFLDNLQSKQAEIVAAATLVGVSDFVSRWQELDGARDALVAATTGNIGAVLAGIVAALPDETIL